MMPFPVYTEARLRARMHVQVAYEAPWISSLPGYFTIQGEVKTIFRDGNCLKVGDRIRFDLAVYADGDEERIPAGGDLWIDRTRLENGKHMEVFLDGTPPDCTVAASQYEIIPQLSDTPVMQVPTEEQVAEAWAAFEHE